MPTYEYRCSFCSHELEIMQNMTDAPLLLCPQCKQKALQRGPGGGQGVLSLKKGEETHRPPEGHCACGKTSCRSK
ncbi:MAG: zinc ribbon domain-containing protein [Chlamydiia bacterium]|nr:zinc ribbon domain-containing protein [Chlamydiia bacterium]